MGENFDFSGIAKHVFNNKNENLVLISLSINRRQMTHCLFTKGLIVKV